MSLYIVNILYSKGSLSVCCLRTFSTLSKWNISKTNFGQNLFVTSLGWPKCFHGNQNINSYRLIMGKIFLTRLELFFIRSSSNLSVTKTGVSLGRVRFPDKPDYSFGCYLPLCAEDLSHILIMGEMLSNFQVKKAEIKSRMTTISELNWIKHLEVTCSWASKFFSLSYYREAPYFMFDRTIIKLAGNLTRNKTSNKLNCDQMWSELLALEHQKISDDQIGPDLPINCLVSCVWKAQKSHRH